MEMPRPTDAAKAAFRALVPDAPGVEVRPMFGQLAAFVGGNMFMALYGDALALKLAPDSLAAALARPDASPFAPAGRTMREYVCLPLASDAGEEIDAALTYVARMPPKRPRACWGR